MENMLAPEAIEELICEHPLVRSCIVVGHDRTYYGVMILPDKESLNRKLYEEEPHASYNLETYQGLNHIDIRCLYCDMLEMVNKKLTGKRIERFALLDEIADKPREEICADNKIIIDSFYRDYIPGIG